MDQMDQQKRLLLTIVLTTVVMGVWFTFFGGTGSKPPPTAPAAADAGPLAAVPSPTPAPGPDAGTPAVTAEPEKPPEAPERTINITTPAQELVFNSRGGGLVKAVVKNAGKWPESKFLSREKDEKGVPLPVDMARFRIGRPLPGAIEITGDATLPLTAAYGAERIENGAVFRIETGGLVVEKRYQVSPNGYELRQLVRIENKGAARNLKLAAVWPAHVDPATQKGGSFFAPRPELSEAICRYDKSTERAPVKDEATENSWSGTVRFAGYDERYFMGVIFPRFELKGSCTLKASTNGDLLARIEEDLGNVGAGQTVTREFGLYIGPKELDELERVSEGSTIGAPLTTVGQKPVGQGGAATADPQLPEAIDFGWWAVICRVLLAVMKLFQGLVVNWGIAIVLLTVLVKVLLYPLSHKQMESMEAMRRLQPQMEAITKKYPDDKEKQNLERMKLFQENKVNPFGGCLPLLVQMPVWIALYQTLLSSFELYREPLLAFWIQDLTAKDPIYALPLAMGVTMFITQKMQPQMGDPTQAKVMLYFMPVFFTFIMLSLPAGLTLYIFTNNLLSIAQQKYLQHKFAKKDAAKPAKS